MEPLLMFATQKTPSVDFDAQKGVMELIGRSNPEDATRYYQPLFEWIGEYSRVPQASTTFNIKVDYFNTTSSKQLFTVFKMLQMINEDGKSEVNINWYHDEHDECIQEAGEDYAAMMSVPFNIIEE